MSDSDESGESGLLEFPCDFPVKMMGRDEPAFHAAAREIIARHVPADDSGEFRPAMSRNARFVSLTVTLRARSQQQLDRIYEDLSAHEAILVAL